MPAPRQRVTHTGPWLLSATPIVVPASRARDQPSNFDSKNLVLGIDGKVRIPGSNKRKRPGTPRWKGDQKKEGEEGSCQMLACMEASQMHSKVAVKSAEAQDSVLIPLPDHGYLEANLDLSSNSPSFPPLLHDSNGRSPAGPRLWTPALAPTLPLPRPMQPPCLPLRAPRHRTRLAPVERVPQQLQVTDNWGHGGQEGEAPAGGDRHTSLCGHRYQGVHDSGTEGGEGGGAEGCGGEEDLVKSLGEEA